MYPRTSIEEANKHLQALYKRIQELENTVVEQEAAMLAKDELLEERVARVSSAKDADIRKLADKVRLLESKLSSFTDDVLHKEQQIVSLEIRCKHLDSILSFQAPMKNLLRCMESAGGGTDSVIAPASVDPLTGYQGPHPDSLTGGEGQQPPALAVNGPTSIADIERSSRWPNVYSLSEESAENKMKNRRLLEREYYL